MEHAGSRTAHGLLTRHFLREFLENDLVSPDADRSQMLAVVGGGLMTLTLFITVFKSFKYLGPALTPGQVAVLALDDRYFYLALAMVISALVATSQWDALVINPRDAAILEPLPVAAGTIRRAKLAAVGILGAAVAVGINLAATIVFPWLLVFNLRQLSLVAMLGLMLAHAVFTIAAAVFGYLVVIAIREVTVAVLGRQWFTRVSPWLQGALIVLLGGALLLLPGAADRIARAGFDGWRPLSPPMWFLGAYEMTVGRVVVDVPRAQMRPRQVENDRITTAMYQARRGTFPALARRAVMALALAGLFAAAAYLWNARRLPSLAPAPPPTSRRSWRAGARVLNALMMRHASMRAGFYFALAAMWRSNTHRLTLACAAAAGLAMSVVALSNAQVQAGGGASARLLAMQPLLYGALLVGFRHTIRVPAELRANWGFQLAWRGHDRAFLAGVKHAAVLALVVPALVLLLPLYVFVLGVELALLHAALGLAGGVVLLEALTVNYDKVPFTCTYLPNEKIKALAPIYVIAFVLGATIFARMQYAVLEGTDRMTLVITLVIAFAALRLTAAKRARMPQIDFDEAPRTFQYLGLHQ